MTPQMVDVLYRISLLYAPEPETIFRAIVDAISTLYGGTMAMVNLLEEQLPSGAQYLRFRTVANCHPAFADTHTLDLSSTICQFALKAEQPLLIQNAVENPELCHHAVVDLKLRRYLGVPIKKWDGKTIGTLCILDDHTDAPLTTDDIQFLSLLAMRVSTELDRERMMEERISEQRSYAERLEVRLREQSEALKRAQDKLLETAQMWAVGEVATGIAHDLRNVLAAIKVEMQTAPIAHPENIARHWDRLYVLTHSLLALSETTTATFDTVQVEDILNFVLKLLKNHAEIGRVRFRKRITKLIPPVLGDARRLEHLFINLVLNALDALTINTVSTEGGLITITIRSTPDSVFIEIRDNGPGMEAEHQKHLFEPFFSTRANRTGLGLFSARRIAIAHRGDIWVKSQPGSGTRVCVKLPVYPTEVNEEI